MTGAVSRPKTDACSTPLPPISAAAVPPERFHYLYALGLISVRRPAHPERCYPHMKKWLGFLEANSRIIPVPWGEFWDVGDYFLGTTGGGTRKKISASMIVIGSHSNLTATIGDILGHRRG